MVQREVEIVGLNSSTNGRSCYVHDCCGEVVKKGDLIRLKKCIVTVNNIPQEAIKCVRVHDGVEPCTIGFIPKVLVKNQAINTMLNRFAQIVELYNESESTMKRRKSTMYKGMAKCTLLDHVLSSE